MGKGRGLFVGVDEVAGEDGYLQKQIDELNRKVNAATGQSTSTADPCVPNFAIAYETIKNRLRGTFCSNVPGNTGSLITSIIRQLDAVDPATNPSPATNYDNAQLTDRYELDDDETANQHVEYRFGPRLDYNTIYWLTRLVAVDRDSGAKIFNPSKRPVFSDTPLATFTTPVKFGSPSAPHVGNIIENKPDDVTKAFDAFLVIQIIAPYATTAVGAGTVSVNSGSTTVVGIGTGFTGADVGKAITVNGETHIIAAFTDATHVDMDFPFRQTLAGQAYAKLVLQTWAQADAEAVVAKFRLTDDANGRAKTERHIFTDDEIGQTSIKFRVGGFIAARKYNWMTNVIIGHSERTSINPLATQTFIAGGFAADTPGIPELTGPEWHYDASDQGDGFKLTSFFVTQPNPCVPLDNVEIQRRIPGTGTISYINGNTTINGAGTLFTQEVAAGNTIIVGNYLAGGYQRLIVDSVTDDTHLIVEVAPNATLGGQAYKIGHILDDRGIRRAKFHPATGGQIKFHLGDLKAKKLATQDFVVIITSQNGNQREDVDNFTTGDSGSALVPIAIAFPTLNSNSVDGDPDKAMARIALNLATVSGTFAANNVSQVEIVLIRRNAANSADVGNPFSEIKVLSTSDLAASSCVHEFFMRMGQKFRVTKVVARNGDKRAETTGTLDLTAGGVLQVDTGDAKTVPAPTFNVQPAADGNKHASFTVRLTQDGVDIVLFKRLVVEKSYGGGPFRNIEGSPLGLKALDDLHASVSGSHDFVFTVPRKPGATLDVRVTAVAVGGKTSATTNATQLAASVDDQTADTAAPSGLSAPVIDWTAAGRLRIRNLVATTNIHSLKNKYIVITDGLGNYLSIPNRNLTAIENPNARYNVGLLSHLTLDDIKKKIYSTVFGSGGSFQCYWYAENDVNVSAASGNSNVLTVASLMEVMSDDLDAIRVVDVSANMNAPQNLLYNGEMGYSTATPTVLQSWRAWDKVSNISNGGTTTITTTSGPGLSWDQANHLIKWDDEPKAIVQKLQRTPVPGDFYSLTFMIVGTGVFTFPFPSIDVDVLLQGTTTSALVAPPTIALGGVSGIYKMMGVSFQIDPAAATGIPMWLAIKTSFNLTGAKFLSFDRPMLVKGKTPYSFVPHPKDASTLSAGVEDYDVATNSISSPDTGNPTRGAQGGWTDPGGGVEISVF